MNRQLLNQAVSSGKRKPRFRAKRRFYILIAIFLMAILGLSAVFIFGSVKNNTPSEKQGSASIGAIAAAKCPKEKRAPALETQAPAPPKEKLEEKETPQVEESVPPAVQEIAPKEEPPKAPAVSSGADDYFSNALFIGDSRTQGLMMHSGLTLSLIHIL